MRNLDDFILPETPEEFMGQNEETQATSKEGGKVYTICIEGVGKRNLKILQLKE